MREYTILSKLADRAGASLSIEKTEREEGFTNGLLEAIEIVKSVIREDETGKKDESVTIHIAEEVSNCCGAGVYENSDICMDCKEHCGIEKL